MPDESASDRIRSQFNEIVDGLELELPDDLSTAPTPTSPTPANDVEEPIEFDDLSDDRDEQFYRDVGPIPFPSRMPLSSLIAWVGALGIPAVLMISTLFGVFWPRPFVLSGCFICVASASWLFFRLPARERPDSPDDGAVL